MSQSKRLRTKVIHLLVVFVQILSVLGMGTATFSQPTLPVAQDAGQTTQGTWFTQGLDSVAQWTQQLFGAKVALAQTGSPGGIATDLSLWLRADAGITVTVGSQVGPWGDQSGDSNNATATGAPVLTNGINFNPSIYYNGVDGHDMPNSLTNQYTVFTVARLQGTQNGRLFASQTGNVLIGYHNNYEDVLYLDGSPSFLTAQAATTNPHLYTLRRDAGGGYQMLSAGTNLYAGAGAANSVVRFGIANGGVFGASQAAKGYVSEVIAYDRSLTTAQINQVESYLAIKYGFTLGHNYFTSAGDPLYNISSYGNNVAGIGRDDTSNLNQKQSKSTAADSLVTMGLGMLAGTNISNTNTFADDASFLLWSNNSGSTQFSTPLTGPGSTTVNNRMTRLWRAQETGTVGTVKVAIPASVSLGNTTYLVVSNNATIDDNDDFLPLSPQTVDGIDYLSTDFNFASGTQYFTFATYATAPGGVVPSLGWWFQGNAGLQTSGSAVTGWQDGNGLVSVSQGTVASQPTATKYQNFNPIVTFDGVNDALINGAGYWKGTTGNQQYNTFIVSTNQNAGGVNAAFAENTVQGQQTMFLPYTGNVHNGLWIGPVPFVASSNQIGTVGMPYLWSGTYNNSSVPKLNTISQNGKEVGTSALTVAFDGNNSPLYLGGSGNGWQYNGDIAEVAMYATDLTPIQRQQIQSYLALKWGISLDQSVPTNYLASDGSIYWDVAASGVYTHNIAGIAYDLSAGLNQKQSRSVNTTNSGNIVTIGLGAIAATNADNASVLTVDRSAMVWSDNGEASQFATALTGPGSTILNNRMTRVWRVQENGTVGSVQVAIPATTGLGPTVYLVVSDDDTIDASDDYLPLSLHTVGSTNYLAANVNFDAGQYFTFATYVAAPGGIVPDLKLWLKADNGTGVPVNNTVGTWYDQSIWNNHGAPTGQPMLTYGLNYNPAVYYNSATATFLDGHNMPNTLNGEYTIVTVARMEGGRNRRLFASQQGNVILGYYNNKEDVIFLDGNPNLLVGQNANIVPNLYTIKRATGGAFEMQSMGNILYSGPASTNSNIQLSIGNGGLQGAAEASIAYVSEVIAYDRELTAAEVQKIETYLAIKYGLTLGRNYNDSAENLIYSTGTYGNNIAGIGRDDSSGLNQRQSHSSNDNTFVSMSLGALAPLNMDNTSVFTDDLSFVLFGDDDGATTFGELVTGAPYPLERIDRTWKVRATGNPGPVSVLVPQGAFVGNTPVFILSVDQTIDGSDTFIPMTDDGQGNFQALINFPVGVNRYFTLAENPVKETIGKTSVKTDVPISGVGMVTTTWLITYNNTTGKILNNVVLNDIFGPDQTYVNSSLEIPPGWDAQYSTDSGATYDTAEPVSGVNALRFSNPFVAPNALGQGRTMNLPFPGSVDLSGAGDGYWPVALQNGRIMGVNHHTAGNILWCYDPAANGMCAGYPKNPGFLTGNAPWTIASGNRIYVSYFPANASPIHCWDGSTDSPCGMINILPAGTAHMGPRMIDEKLYIVTGTGNMDCYDPTTLLRCAGYPIAIGIGAIHDYSGVNTLNNGDMVIYGDRIYVSNYAAQLTCFDTVTKALCADWNANPILATGVVGTYPDAFLRRDATGQSTGICLAPDGGNATCFNLDGTTPQTVPMASVHIPSSSGVQTPADATIGTRTFFSTWDNVTCWDWATNAPCVGDGYLNGHIGNTSTVPYGLGTNSACLLVFGDAGILKAYDPITGLSCRLSSASMKIAPQIFACGGAPASFTWDKVKTYDTNLTANVEFSSYTITVRDANTGQLLAGPQEMIGTNGEVDLSGIPVSVTEIEVLATSLPVSTYAWNDGVAPKVAGTFLSNKAPQFCYQTVTAVDCNTDPTQTITNSVASVLTLDANAAAISELCLVPDANLTISKSAPMTGTQGVNFNYTFVVTNTGTGPTSGDVIVYDTLPAGVSFVSSSGGFVCSAVGQAMTCVSNAVIAAGATTTFDMLVTPTGSGIVVNLAQVIGGDDVTPDTSNTVTTTVEAAPKPDLSISKSGPMTATLGTDFSYTFVITNTGNGPTFGTVTVNDTLPAGLSFVSGTGGGFTCSAVGQLVTCTGTGVIASPNGTTTFAIVVKPVALGSQPNTAIVIGGGDTTISTSNTVTTIVILPPMSDLSIGKSGPVTATQGVNFDYIFVITNTGPDATVGTVTVTDTLPAGVSYMSSTGGGFACSAAGQLVTCTSNDVIVGSNGTITFTMVVNPANSGNITNVANVIGGGDTTSSPSNPVTTTVIAAAIPNLTISKSGPMTATQGVDFTYTFVVTNTGSSPTSGTVTVTDTLPVGLTYVSSSGGFACSAAGQVVTCTSNTVIADANGTATFTMVVTPTGSGNVSNTATVAGGGDSTPAPSNPVSTTITIPAAVVILPLKVMLGGAYSSVTGLMDDGLRTQSLIPTAEPYAQIMSFTHMNGGGGETVNASVFATAGSNAIVDWVFIELRSSADSATVLATRSALVQRDGDVVGLDGTNILELPGSFDGQSYYVAIRHRNHLGAMTNSTVTLSATTPLVDFTDTNTQIYGTNAMKLVGGVPTLWSGNTNTNKTVINAGPSNDISPIMAVVLGDPANTEYNLNFVIHGYSLNDVNLDGDAIAAGPGSDVTPIVGNVLTHPSNTKFAANYIILQQLP